MAPRLDPAGTGKGNGRATPPEMPLPLRANAFKGFQGSRSFSTCMEPCIARVRPHFLQSAGNPPQAGIAVTQKSKGSRARLAILRGPLQLLQARELVEFLQSIWLAHPHFSWTPSVAGRRLPPAAASTEPIRFAGAPLARGGGTARVAPMEMAGLHSGEDGSRRPALPRSTGNLKVRGGKKHLGLDTFDASSAP